MAEVVELGEKEEMMQGLAVVRKYTLAFADSMALKCAVELGIADIINAHGHPITLSEIASGLRSPSPDLNSLSRIMRFLVRKGVFSSHSQEESQAQVNNTLYGLTHASKWLLRDVEPSFARVVLAMDHPWLMAPWHYLSKCVEEGGNGFSKAHGLEIWDFASANPEFNKLFNGSMSNSTKISVDTILWAYKDRFGSIGSLVDVGGGIGTALKEIVKAHPHIRGINFDLPHVVSIAPEYPGVTHIGGDMFTAIPEADAIFIKGIMHDWGDEDCVKILKNCRKAIPDKIGKLIIVDVVLQLDGEGFLAELGMVWDLMMMAHTSGGRERTEMEWKTVLEEAGFPRYQIIQIPNPQFIIEAYPE